MDTVEQLKSLLQEQLQLGEIVDQFNAETRLFGDLPEFDSMAVVNIVTAIEERFDVVVDDDELTADVFETVGSLADFISLKVDG